MRAREMCFKIKEKLRMREIYLSIVTQQSSARIETLKSVI